MMSDTVRKAVTTARCVIARELALQTRLADLDALVKLDHLLIADGQLYHAREASSSASQACDPKAVGLTFTPDEKTGEDAGDVATASKLAELQREIDKLNKERDRDSALIAGLQADLERARKRA